MDHVGASHPAAMAPLYPQPMKPRFNPLLALGCLSLITVSATHAADRIKANNTTALNLDGSWTTSAPLATDVAVWDSTVIAANTSSLDAVATWQGIRIANPTGLVTINGGSLLTLTPDVGVLGIDMTAAAASTNNLTINASVLLGSEQTWNVAASRVLSVSGAISGSTLLTKAGAGQLILGGTNTTSGGILLSEGTLTLNGGGALGSATGDLTIKAATTLATSALNGTFISVNKPVKLDGSFTYLVQGTSNGLLHLGAGPVTLNNNITVTNASGVLAMAGDVSGNFALTKSGNGTLALLGNMNYTGQTTVTNSSNLRVATTTSFPGTNIFLDGGVIELGGTLAADNELILGTAPGQVRFKDGQGVTGGSASHGGVGSASGYRRVSITSQGVPNAPLIWGTTPHFISGGSTSSGIFLMGTPQGAGTVELTNAIDFAGAEHRFSIRDGGAIGAPDAVLSGQLTNGTFSTQGTGTVFVSNANNTLTGTTLVTGGNVLRVPAIAGYLGTSNVVLNGGTLELPPGTQVTTGTAAGQVSIVNNGGFSTYGTTNTPISVGAPTDTILFTDLVPTAGSALLLSGASSAGTTTFANPINLNGAVQIFNIANGVAPTDAELKGALSNGGVTMSGGSGALYLSNPSNSYALPTTVSNGSLAVNVLANGGANSSIGASTSDATNLVLNGGGLRYVGTGSTTDRLFTIGSSVTFSANGTGPLDFSNPGDNVFSGTAARTFSLTGIYDGENHIRGTIANAGTGNTSINKFGHTNWTLSGNNTFGGTVEVQAGTLTADHSGGKNAIGNPSQITLNSGNLVIKGGSANVVKTLTNLRLSSGNLALTNNLTLNSTNGSPGIQLTLSTLAGNPTAASTMLSNLFDLSSNPANSITVSAFANNLATSPKTGASATSYNVVMLSNRTNLVVRESTGYGFAYRNGSNQIKALPLSDGVVVTPASGTNGEHLRLTYEDTVTAGTPGIVTRTSSLTYGTLALDSSGGSVTLDLGANVLGSGTTGENGRGILITGENAANSVTLTGTTPMITSGTNAGYSPFIYNYSKGDFNLGMSVDAGISLILGGTGMINLTGPVTGSNVKIYANGCHLRMSGTSNLGVLAFNSGMWVSGGGILEVGNDLSGMGGVDFAQPVGNADSNIRFVGDSGISAHGGYRVVNFGGASDTLVWGSNYFLTNSGGADNDSILLLSSTRSDSTLEIQNPISLNLRDRVIKVARGATTPSGVADAVLSGEISGAGAGIIKNGAGILALDGNNSYTGTTQITEGVLRFMKPSLADSSTVSISSGARIDLSHGQTDVIGALIVNGVPVAPNIYGASNLPTVITGTGKLNVGGVVATQTPFEQWADTKNLPAGKKGPEDDADNDGLRNLLEYAVASEPLQPGGSVLSKVTNGVSFRRALGRTDITSVVETSPDLSLNSWTIVATSTAGGAFVAQSGATVTVNDSALNPEANSVTLTDTATPVPTRKFYRLRVTQNTPIP